MEPASVRGSSLRLSLAGPSARKSFSSSSRSRKPAGGSPVSGWPANAAEVKSV